MTRENIIRMAREVGIDPESDTLCNYDGWVDTLVDFAALVAQRQRDELVAMFLEAHEGAKDNHNYWLVAANKIKEKT